MYAKFCCAIGDWTIDWSVMPKNDSARTPMTRRMMIFIIVCTIAPMDARTRAFAHFLEADTRLHKAVIGHFEALPKDLPGKRTRAELFAALASTVIAQQLGGAAADTIRSRVEKVCGGKLAPAAILQARESQMRAAGLSGSKLKTLRTLAEEVQSGRLDLLELKQIPEDMAKSRLTEIWGIGPWSAEMFLIFALGRHDVFSPGDLGLARAIEAIYGLPKDSPREKLVKISARWSPFRSYACLALWRTRDVKLPVTSLSAARKKRVGK